MTPQTLQNNDVRIPVDRTGDILDLEVEAGSRYPARYNFNTEDRTSFLGIEAISVPKNYFSPYNKN